MKKSIFKTFYVHAGTYDFGINFCITKNTEMAAKWASFKLEEPISKEVFDCLGKRIWINGYCPIVWIPQVPKTPAEIGTLCHEIFHVVCDVMRWAQIPLTNDTEEAWAHLIKHITKKAFEQLKK